MGRPGEAVGELPAAYGTDGVLEFVSLLKLVERGPPLLEQTRWCVARSAAVTVANHWNVAPRTTTGLLWFFFVYCG
jgi:hypothetical protein